MSTNYIYKECTMQKYHMTRLVSYIQGRELSLALMPMGNPLI